MGQTDETLKWDPDKLYSEARTELNNGSWKRSRELYQKLESRYPFGRHAQQALMEIAYTYYKEGKARKQFRPPIASSVSTRITRTSITCTT